MNDDPNPREVIGGNNPPDFDADKLAALQVKLTDYLDAAGAWLALNKIETEDQAGKLTDYISGVRDLRSQIENLRVSEKKPHLDAGKRVDEAFKGPIAKADLAAEKLEGFMTDYLRAKAKRDRAEQQRLAKIAAEKAAEAEREAAAALARNDLSGQVDAQEKADGAAALAKQAERPVKTNVKSATGGGRTIALRRVPVVVLQNINTAFLHYRDNPALAEFLTGLAGAEARTVGVDAIAKGHKIPGFILSIEERV
jgi:hypothetical protein